MLKILSHHIGDSWFFVENNTAHAFFLICPDTIKPHTLWDIGHATSSNLKDWTYHGIALHHDKASWDDSLATGSVIKANGSYHMAYCSMRAQTGIASSPDLFQWTKSQKNPTSSIDASIYESQVVGKRKFLHWRDPFLFPSDGHILQLVCASSPLAPRDAHGTIGVAKSDDLESWSILPPLNVEPFCEEMECPQLYLRDGLYHLVFSTHGDLIPDHKKTPLGEENLSSLYCMVSPNLNGPYITPSNPRVLNSSRKPHPYAAQIIHFSGKDYCIGTIWDDGPISYLCDPIEVHFSENGIHEM